MTIKISGAGPPIDPRTIKIQSPNRKSAPEIDFSRPFRGYDWSDHPSVKGLIDEIFEAYVFWYRECIHGERIRNPGTIRQYLTHFVLEAYRVHVAQPGMMLTAAGGGD